MFQTKTSVSGKVILAPLQRRENFASAEMVSLLASYANPSINICDPLLVFFVIWIKKSRQQSVSPWLSSVGLFCGPLDGVKVWVEGESLSASGEPADWGLPGSVP